MERELDLQLAKAPSTYEMEGASFGLAAPAGQFSGGGRREPPAGAMHPLKSPVARLLSRSRLSG